MQQTKVPTHTMWIQKWEAGKFREWLPVGKGWIDVDENGVPSVHNYQDLTSIGGWSGYSCLMPIGIRPKDPEQHPKRPNENDS
jgi:hypothetical protein